MAKALKRVRPEPGTDLVRIVEAVHPEKTPYLIEREGEPLAVVVSPEDFSGAPIVPTDEGIARALKAAGTWKDLDTDAMLDKFYRSRHEAPPSTPVVL